MPRTAAKVTQADIARVLRAVNATGSKVRVEVLPDGTIRMEPVDVEALTSPLYNGPIRL